MVEKWDPAPGPMGHSGTLETPSDLRDPTEPFGTLRISLGPPVFLGML